MKLTELRQIIREEVRAAIQEELKDILLEAVKSPKSTITETKTAPNPEVQKAFRQQMLSQMQTGNGNMTLTTNDVGTFRPAGGSTAAEGSALPGGNVGLDQIMGLMNSK